MNVKYNKYGKSLGTREMGQELRMQVEESINNTENIVFDFAGIDIISHSYADEIFGKLIKKYGLTKFKEHTNFLNANSFVTDIIINVINESAK